jgi:GNAT superfamily N-acetyltransferase
MNHNFKLQKITDLEKMLGFFPLLQQLNPKLTSLQYETSLKAMLAQGNYFQIVVYDGEVPIGLTGVWIGTKIWSGKYLEVDNFVVDEKYRRHGVGKLLIEWCEEYARDQNCCMIGLDSYVFADQAHRFYFRLGYKIEGFHMTKRF